jgi:integrase
VSTLSATGNTKGYTVVALLFESGAYRIMCKHIQPKGNRWYYRRRVPEDVRHLHPDRATKRPKAELFFSLKTANKAEAARLADAHTRRLDALWKAHREGSAGAANPVVSLAVLEAAGLKPGDALRYPGHDAISDFVDDLIGGREAHEPLSSVSPQDRMTLDLLSGAPVPRTLTDARDQHFGLGKGPRGPVAEKQFTRAWNLLLTVTGDTTLENLRREHANDYVRRLIASGVSGETVRHYVSQIRPVIGTGIREFELTLNNPFQGVTIPNLREGPTKPRDTFTMPELEAIQAKCRSMNDQRRWAISMLSDTMARLAEVVALRKEDVLLEAEVPHVLLRPTPERSLKTSASARLVPLVGEALWAAKSAISTTGPFLFPVFGLTSGQRFSSGAASAALNKWLKDNELVRRGQSLHSFRHTMRDRLRNVEAPADMVDRIGGWTRPGVGEAYGKGHELRLMQIYLEKTVRTKA